MTAMQEAINDIKFLFNKTEKENVMAKIAYNMIITLAEEVYIEKEQQQLSAAFEAGELYGRDQVNVLKPSGQIYPDKETYLKTGK